MTAGPRYERVKEGVCPWCDVALERMDDHGHCPECGARLSLAGNELRLHIVSEWPAAHPPENV